MRFIKLAIVCILALLITGLLQAEDRRIDKNRLRIATLNAEFLFDGIAPDGSANFEWKNSPDEAGEHIAEIAQIIKSMNADIVNLVEVENIEVLESMINNHLAGYGYKAYLVEGTDTYTRQDVAMLTRIDPENFQRWNEKGQSGSVQKSVSKNYYAKLRVNDNDITFIGLHFLAFPTRSDRIQQRQAQADAIRKLIMQVYTQNSDIVVWGDFNDYDGQCLDVQNHMPVTTVLHDIKQANASSTDDDLVSAGCIGFVPQTLRYTSWYDVDQDGYYEYPAEFSSIDHILLSPNLSQYVSSVEFYHDYDPAEVTDHYPIIVDFVFEQNAPTIESAYISALLPNPEGNERTDEVIWITNPTGHEIDIKDWLLRDKAGHELKFNSSTKIGSNKTLEIKRNGAPLSLNNNGDVIELIDKDGKVLHSVSYERALEGEILEFTQ
ncbi:MAG: lamin tail domain-containing protein [Candidatus Zixiibacteriota bacterium]